MKHTNELEGVAIIKKLDDVPALKEKLISVYETKSHKDVSRYSLLLAEHVLALSGMPANETVESCFSVCRAWQEGDAKFQEARQVAFALHRHALVASDYAVKLVNRMFPGNLEKVREMRETQIFLLEQV